MASFIVYGDSSGQVTVAAPAIAGSNTITFPAETGTLITDASPSSAMPNSIQWDTTVKTSGFTAVAYGGYFCNTTGGAFTVTLPATPTRGQFVVIVDYAGTSATNNITVSGNGANINGGSSKLLQTNRQGITFTYIDSTQGWLATSNVYGGSTPFINVPYSVSYLVVGGGGSMAGNNGGGGGAGGLLTGTFTANSGTVYTITVGSGGSGGAGNAASGPGQNGGSSSVTGSGLSTITANGGGYGGSNGRTGSPGGSGGGGGVTANAGGSGTPGQGNAGGNGTSNNGGGGGGASAAGTPGSTSFGVGGAGTASSITGSPITYAGGGGGGGNATGGTGGSGGGGPGTGGITGTQVAGTAGTANTGGGAGGGNNYNSTAVTQANGGSGVIILSIPTSSYSGTYTGASVTVSTSGSNTILQFNQSGTYTG